MNLKRHLRAVLAALLLVATLAPAALTDEGMWTFNNVPRAEIERKYGFRVTDEWLKKVQLASVRFNNGGSGSFVSPEGLVLTNYHIVEDFVGELSTPQKDYAKEGYVARTRAEELKIPATELNVLQSIEDVTDRVNARLTPQTPAAEAFASRRAAIADIERESAAKTGLRSDVVTLFQGGRYNLYRYKKYTDVRLVFCPEFQAAFFGGDPDNFEFPRFNIDMALVRVYENGQPVHPESYLKWSTKGVEEGELVFITGHPGSTQRLNTVAHLESLRDLSLPLIIKVSERREAALKQYMAQGEEQTRRAQNDLNGVQNALKVYRSQLKGLQDAKMMASKQAAEAKLVNAIKADARHQAAYGDAWSAIAAARRALATFERDRRFLELSAAFNTAYFAAARAIVRLAYEGEKPDAERLAEYTEARRHSTENTLLADAPLYNDLERAKLAASLDLFRETYGADSDLVKRVLEGKTPEARAAELIDGTKLKDFSYRKQLVAGGRKAVDESDDPMIKLALSINKEARLARARYDNEVTSVERDAYAKIARAIFETEGDKVYPDATFTLRLSYGAVKGYKENGKTVQPFTYFSGLYERAAEHGNKFPYNLPPRWTEKKSAVDLKTPFNFVSTNDIIGGNSGSPTINKEGELVGLIFDGNRQSIVGNFYYDESINRAISVDVRAMLEALRKVYGAKEVADELAGPVAPAEEPFGRVVPVPYAGARTNMASPDGEPSTLEKFDQLPRAEKERLLVEEGPFFPADFALSDYSIRAFVKGGWPVTVEYGLEAGSIATITIEANGTTFTRTMVADQGPVKVITLENEAGAETHIPMNNGRATFSLPTSFGERTQVAKVFFRAIRGGPQRARALFKLHALGLGDQPNQAAGAAAFEPASFLLPQTFFEYRTGTALDRILLVDPLSIRLSLGQQFGYKFHSETDLSRLFASFVTDYIDSGGAVRERPVYGMRLGSIGRDQWSILFEWNGRKSNGAESRGPHYLRLRGSTGTVSNGKSVICSPDAVLTAEP